MRQFGWWSREWAWMLVSCVAGLVLGLPIGCTMLRSPLVAIGAPAAHRLDAPPFLIATNFPLAEQHPLVRELADLREQVQDTLRLSLSERRIEVYIFDDRPTYERFIAAHYPELPRRRAFFIAQDDREVVYTFRGERLDEDVRHEASHALIHSGIGNVPLWLDEGLAEYFESPGEAAGLHVRHLAECQTAREHGWLPDLKRLEKLTQVHQMTKDDYREGWAWIYFLLHGSPEGNRLLLMYLEDVRNGTCRDALSSRLFRAMPRADRTLIDFLTHIDTK